MKVLYKAYTAQDVTREGSCLVSSMGTLQLLQLKSAHTMLFAFFMSRSLTGGDLNLVGGARRIVQYGLGSDHAFCREADAGCACWQPDNFGQVCEFELRCGLLAIADWICPFSKVIRGHVASMSLVVHAVNSHLAACRALSSL